MTEQRNLIESQTATAAAVITDEIIGGGIAILGKTGSGKTVVAKGLVERLLTENRRVCIIDPTGVWYGLRSSADGLRPGFPVVVFGGEHADVPIGAASGDALSAMIANERIPAIIDISLFEEEEIEEFMTAFLRGLYVHNRKPLTLVVDEADMFAPQIPRKDQTTQLSAMQTIARRGRVRGFRLWQLSQRPAVLNKSVLSMADTIVAMKLVSPQDRNALGDWISGQADKIAGKRVLAELPQLPRGTGFVWSPEGQLLERTAFPMITTFDSSRTPEENEEEIAEPTRLADVDVSGLIASLQVAISESEANDPIRLRARIAELETALAEQPESEASSAALKEAVDGGYENGYRACLAMHVRRTDDLVQAITNLLQAHVEDLVAPAQAGVSPSREGPVVDSRPILPAANPSQRQTQRRTLQQRVIDAIYWWNIAGVSSPTREQVGFVAGATAGSGHFNNTISGLKTAGLLVYPDTGRVALTEAGAQTASPVDRDPSRAELINRAKEVIRESAQKRVFSVVASSGGAMSRAAAAAAAGMNLGGHFNNTVSALKTAGLLRYPESGAVALSSAFEALQ